MIVNACSFFGRLAPGLVANKLGVTNILTISAFICAALILSMIALGNVASVVVIGILYGFFSGACEYRTIRLLSPKLICPPKDISMLGPVLAALTDNMSELGYVFAES